jgi:hypothetical protein
MELKNTYDVQNILLSWDVSAEQKKADFIEYLFEHYQPESRLYTGLWERFKEDLAVMFREYGKDHWPIFSLYSATEFPNDDS